MVVNVTKNKNEKVWLRDVVRKEIIETKFKATQNIGLGTQYRYVSLFPYRSTSVNSVEGFFEEGPRERARMPKSGTLIPPRGTWRRQPPPSTSHLDRSVSFLQAPLWTHPVNENLFVSTFGMDDMVMVFSLIFES